MQFINTQKITKGMGILGDIPSQREIVRRTLEIAWPSVVESFFVNLVGVINTIMVSVLGAHAIAAVGLTTQPRFFGLALFFSLNVAVSAIVARRRGENDKESANKIMKMAVLFTVVLTALVSMVLIFFADPIIRLVGSQPDTHDMSVEYFRIIIAGLIFTTISLVINAAQRGAGNTRIAMVTNVTSNLVNVALNYVLISGNLGFPALGIRGSAIATVIGSMVACTLSILSILKKDRFLYWKSVKGFVIDRLSIGSITKVGSGAFIEQICLRIGFLLFTITVAKLGTEEFAAHQIGMNMMSMSFSFGDGFSIAAVTLIGQSLGMKRPDMAKIYGNACQKIGLLCACGVSLFYFTCGRYIFYLYTSDPIILDYGVMIMRILSVALFLQIAQVVQLGCLRGAGDILYTTIISLLCVTIIRPGASWILCYPLGLGLMGAWLGTACDQIARFTMSFIRFRQGKWVEKRL